MAQIIARKRKAETDKKNKTREEIETVNRELADIEMITQQKNNKKKFVQQSLKEKLQQQKAERLNKEMLEKDDFKSYMPLHFPYTKNAGKKNLFNRFDQT